MTIYIWITWNQNEISFLITCVVLDMINTDHTRSCRNAIFMMMKLFWQAANWYSCKSKKLSIFFLAETFVLKQPSQKHEQNCLEG